MSTMSVPQDTEPAGKPPDPFRVMAEFFRMWLSGARHWEILRAAGAGRGGAGPPGLPTELRSPPAAAGGRTGVNP